MAQANTNLRLDISVGLDGLVQGLKVATTGVNEAAQQMSLGMGQAGQAFKESGAHGEKHAAFLRDFKKEQMSNGRVARWYAGELTSIIPGAEGARGALQHLLAMGFEGFGLGLAIEAVALVLKVVAEHAQLAAENMEKLEKIGTDMGRKVAESLRDIEHELAGPWTKVEEVMYRTRTEALKRMQEIHDATDKETKKLGSFWHQLWQTLPGIETSKQKLAQLRAEAQEVLIALSETKKQSLGTRNIETAAKDKEVTKERIAIEREGKDEIVRIRQEMINRVAEIDKRQDLTQRQKNELRVAVEQGAMERIARIEEARAVQVNNRLRALHAAHGTERERLEAELQNKIAEMRLRVGRDLSQRDFNRIVAAERAAMEAKLAIQTEADRVRIAKQMEEDAKAAEAEAVQRAEQHAEFTRQSVAWMRAGYDAERAEMLARMKERYDLEKAQLDRLIEMKVITAQVGEERRREIERRYERERVIATNSYVKFSQTVMQNMTSQFQQGLAMMMRGQLSFSNAMRGLWKLMLTAVTDAIAQMITTWLTAKLTELIADKVTATGKITAAAGVAGANAYAANVGIPVVGPAVAAAAATAAVGATMGFVGMVAASYAGGTYQLRSDQLAMLHKDEMVMTASQSRGIRNLIEQGGSGPSITAHFTIHAVDGPSVDRMLTSRQGTIYKLLEAAVRNGRLATR